ncbi:hypothetical protein ACLOJK_020221 [Asimina triloba]
MLFGGVGSPGEHTPFLAEDATGSGGLLTEKSDVYSSGIDGAGDRKMPQDEGHGEYLEAVDLRIPATLREDVIKVLRLLFSFCPRDHQ